MLHIRDRKLALSTIAIAHQIVSSLYTYRKESIETINGCKVVFNHLISKFSEPLSKECLQKRYNLRNRFILEF
ncbi:MAG: hypothetical protein ACI9O6_001992 [Glaciecola sp.]|jgi:hypothetical protein